MTRIRIVDDDLEYSEALAAQLTQEGYSVTTRDCMRTAVEDLIAEPADLVILDVMFPDNPAAGFDAARAIRENPETSGLPVILLTGVNQEFPMDFSSSDIDPDWMPVEAFLEKPPDIPALVKKIEELLQERK